MVLNGITAVVMALADQVGGVPIAHALRPDGCIVIVFEDGRKLVFEPEGDDPSQSPHPVADGGKGKQKEKKHDRRVG